MTHENSWGLDNCNENLMIENSKAKYKETKSKRDVFGVFR